ncbi:MAG TPA: translesion DNA synthesis-associated protein ImuA [Steroidobacteraceae bacterium]|nr:translesion DNA synthesis-associated protein ImuA [Steroidobacteraceae bacterium]
MVASLDTLLSSTPALWRANGSARASGASVPSEFALLDERLPGGGWPQPGLIEVLHARSGIGELSLFVPALQRLIANESGPAARSIAWLNPPHLPYAPAFAERGIDPARLLVSKTLTPTQTLWATEQALRSGACLAVLSWIGTASLHSLRRLKLAAHAGGCLGVLFRPLRQRAQPSPATLRLALWADEARLAVELVKVQGSKPGIVMLNRWSRP